MGREDFKKKMSSLKGEFDILCVGELLTDYISKEDKPLKEATVFDMFLGGSPANIVFHMTHLGKKPLLITKIGDDKDGKFLLKILKEHNVIDTHVKVEKEKDTTKSFISPSVGNPEFDIIRGADTLLREEEIDFDLVRKAKIVHTNAFSLAEEPTRGTILKVLEKAKEAGKIISFDPNYRRSWWPDRDDALMVFREVYKTVDLTKPSMDDAWQLFGDMKAEDYIKRYHELGANIVVLTMGKEGSLISDGSTIMKVLPEQCEGKDATGAGDLYWAVFLAALLDESTLETAGRKASFGAVRVVEQRGAVLDQDQYNAIQAYMKLF